MSNHHTNSTWLRNFKTTFVLSDIQKDVLIGTLLGDGYLRLSVSGKSARLQVYHSIHAKEYVLWKRNIFKNMILADPFYQSVNRAIRFTTVSHSSLLEFQQVFYKERTKTIPINIEKYLISPLSLTVWFMDDGNGYMKNDACRLSTYAFGLKGNILLQSCLKLNFDLDVHLVRDSKGYQIYIPTKNRSASKFRNLVFPYIIPTMKYKLEHRSPVETYIGGTR